MDAQAATDEVIKRARGKSASARKDSSGQEATLHPEIIEEHIDELVADYEAAQDAADKSSDGIKKVAEESGYNTKNVRALIIARVKNTVRERRRDCEQQLELFNKVGALGGSDED
jgi:predicted DNA-binding protein